MYDYRGLSEHERAEIKRMRIEQGYPLHSPPHSPHESGFFLITAAIFEHKQILFSPKRRTEFELKLLAAYSRVGGMIHAWVILPNHYHILLSTACFRTLSTITKQLHGSSSRQWNVEDGTTGRRVWFYYADRRIRGERHFFATLNYLHHNPVKHRFASKEDDWPWSSFHLYLADHGADWIGEIGAKYPILDYGEKWDR